MSKPHRNLIFNSFLGGQNTRLEATLLGEDEAQATADVEMYTGALSGTLNVGAAVYSNTDAVNARWIWFAGSGNMGTGAWAASGLWLWADETRFAMRDGDVSYVTRRGLRPVIVDGVGNSYTLGVLAPENLPVTVGAGGALTGTFAFGITYKTFDGDESNIQNFPAIYVCTSNILTFTSIWPNDSRVSEVHLWRAPVTNGVIGTYNRLTATSDRAVTSLVADGQQALGSEELTWTYGGFPGNDATKAALPGAVAAVYTADHSPAPILSGLADRMHAMGSGLSAGSGAMAIGWIENVLRHSTSDNPRYWPAYGEDVLPSKIEAVIVYTGFAAVFTIGGTFEFAGSSDSAMSTRRLDAGYPIRRGWGKSAVKTDHGTIYVSRDGLALFDGSRTQLISQFKIPRDYFDSLVLYDAGYFDDEYRIFHSTGQLIVDLKDGWEKARFSESDNIVRCCSVADFANPIIADAQGSFPGSDIRESVAAAITLSASATGSWITPGATNSFYRGQIVQVAHGTNSFEVTNIQAISGSQINAVFAVSHAAGATISAGTQLGRRRFGFASDRLTQLYVVGGTEWNLTTATESAVSTAYTYNTATSSATWQEAGTMSGARADIDVVRVGVTLFAFGGTSNGGSAGAANVATMQMYGTGTGVWSTSTTTLTATGIGGGNRKAYAATADELSTSEFWLQGGHDGTNVVATGYRYAVSTNAWTTISATGAPALMFHSMCYMPGSAFSDSQDRLFVFGGATTTAVASGTDIVYAYNLSTNAWANDSSLQGSGISSAEAAMVPKRSRHIWRSLRFSNKIVLHGGIATDGAGLADLWEFDPVVWVTAHAASTSAVAAWVNHADSVIGVEDRYWHGGAIVNLVDTHDRLFLAGGASALSPFNADLYRVTTDDLLNQQTTQGLYVLRNADAGQIRRLKGGQAQQWDWQSKDFLGDNPVAYKWLQKVYADYIGDVNIGVAADNNSIGSMLTLSSATRAQEEYWLPYSAVNTATGAKPTNNTLTTLSSVTGSAVGTGSYNLVVARDALTPPGFTFNWAQGVTQSFSNGWPSASFPMTLVGAGSGGSLIINDNGGPPGSGGVAATFTDAVAVTATASTPRGQRLSFRLRGATTTTAASGVAGELWSATFELGEEAGE